MPRRCRPSRSQRLRARRSRRGGCGTAGPTSRCRCGGRTFSTRSWRVFARLTADGICSRGDRAAGRRPDLPFDGLGLYRALREPASYLVPGRRARLHPGRAGRADRGRRSGRGLAVSRRRDLHLPRGADRVFEEVAGFAAWPRPTSGLRTRLLRRLLPSERPSVASFVRAISRSSSSGKRCSPGSRPPRASRCAESPDREGEVHDVERVAVAAGDVRLAASARTNAEPPPGSRAHDARPHLLAAAEAVDRDLALWWPPFAIRTPSLRNRCASAGTQSIAPVAEISSRHPQAPARASRRGGGLVSLERCYRIELQDRDAAAGAMGRGARPFPTQP